jgi:hypothetical protein
MILVSGGDHRWIFLALANQIEETDERGFAVALALLERGKVETVKLLERASRT